jgi:hypothetical protein
MSDNKDLKLEVKAPVGASAGMAGLGPTQGQLL